MKLFTFYISNMFQLVKKSPLGNFVQI